MEIPFVAAHSLLPDFGPCVYRIYEVKTGKSYIGRATCAPQRMRMHLSLLRVKKHHCQKLQALFTSLGEEWFFAEILEQCSPKEICARENHWFHQYPEALNAVEPSKRMARPPRRIITLHSIESAVKLWRVIQGDCVKPIPNNEIEENCKLMRAEMLRDLVENFEPYGKDQFISKRLPLPRDSSEEVPIANDKDARDDCTSAT